MYKDYSMNVVLKLFFDIFYFMLVSKWNVLCKNDKKINNIDFIYMKSKNVIYGINLLISILFLLIIGGDVFGFRLNLIVKKK